MMCSRKIVIAAALALTVGAVSATPCAAQRHPPSFHAKPTPIPTPYPELRNPELALPPPMPSPGVVPVPLPAPVPFSDIPQPSPPFSSTGNYLTELHARVSELHRRGSYNEAAPVAEEYVDVARGLFGEQHATYAAALTALSIVYRAQGRLHGSGADCSKSPCYPRKETRSRASQCRGRSRQSCSTSARAGPFFRGGPALQASAGDSRSNTPARRPPCGRRIKQPSLVLPGPRTLSRG